MLMSILMSRAKVMSCAKVLMMCKSPNVKCPYLCHVLKLCHVLRCYRW
jgi:hypothetical protein